MNKNERLTEVGGLDGGAVGLDEGGDVGFEVGPCNEQKSSLVRKVIYALRVKSRTNKSLQRLVDSKAVQ